MFGRAKVTIDRTQLKDRLQSKFHEEGFWESIAGRDAKTAIGICQSLINDDDHLERLLLARKHDADATVSLFWEQVQFRTAHTTSSRLHPSRMPHALPSGAWRLCGRDKEGHVLSNYKLHLWQPDEYKTESEDAAVAEYTSYVCYMIELMIQSGVNKNARFSVIFDLEGFYYGMAAQENVRRMIRRLIYVAQAQYPERLHRVYLLNAPYGFSTAWALIKALLDAKTASKIKFSTNAELLNDIDASVLNTEYGGDHEGYVIPSQTIENEAY